MLLTLLTHTQELEKSSNTGLLVMDSLCGLTGNNMPQVRRVIWQRKAPDTLLLEQLQQHRSVLVYPATAGAEGSETEGPGHFIIIDATWQQAQKMLHQSPYLFHLPRLSLAAEKSTYRLRRNQRGQGLCTSEAAAHVLRLNGQLRLAQWLDLALAKLQGGPKICAPQ